MTPEQTQTRDGRLGRLRILATKVGAFSVGVASAHIDDWTPTADGAVMFVTLRKRTAYDFDAKPASVARQIRRLASEIGGIGVNSLYTPRRTYHTVFGRKMPDGYDRDDIEVDLWAR